MGRNLVARGWRLRRIHLLFRIDRGGYHYQHGHDSHAHAYAYSTPTPTPTPAPVGAGTPPQTPPASPPASSGATISGAVTLTGVNNALTANVSVGGTITNVSIIYPALSAWDTTGANVTAKLTALGVNVPALAQQMLAAYNLANPGNTFVSGLSGYQPFPFIWGRGMGQMMRRPMPIRQPVAGRNYVRPGAPMRRIG